MNETSNEAKRTITVPEEFFKIHDAVFDEAAERLGYTREEMIDLADSMDILELLNTMIFVAVCRRVMGDGPLGRATFKRWTILVAREVADIFAESELEAKGGRDKPDPDNGRN